MNAIQTKMARTSRNVEIVETHNLALCFQRLNETAPYDGNRKRRALYHALCMSHGWNHEELAGIRIALKLP